MDDLRPCASRWRWPLGLGRLAGGHHHL